MRIAVVHSFYSSRQPSGENVAVDSEVAALRRNDHVVELFDARTDEMEQSRTYPIRSGLRVASGRGNSPLKELERFAPDIIHIHNLFPNFSRHWILDLDVPVVATLHNYRPLCANGLLFRDGHRCTLCPDGRRWSGVRYACYRGSRLATLPISWSNRRGPLENPVLAKAEKIRVLSHRQMRTYISYGLAPEKLMLIPNFLPTDLAPPPSDSLEQSELTWLYVGRLSEEKGILELLREWPEDAELTVIGDGPLYNQVEGAATARSIRVLGALSRADSIHWMGKAKGLVVPSPLDEGLPNVYLEALACGLPVAAVRGSGVFELVERDRTGGALELSNLSEIANTFQSPALRQHCRATFESKYSEDAFIRSIQGLHRSIPAKTGEASGQGLQP